jgi:hypothetical protein
MIAVDTNLLVYAHRHDSSWHAAAERAIRGLAEATAAWAIPWPCIHEFLAVVTHPRIYSPATPLDRALDQIDAWLESPNLVLLGETDRCWPTHRSTLAASRVAGGKVHDARVAALCIHHGVRRLWTADRDFSRFPDLKTVNPLVGA